MSTTESTTSFSALGLDEDLVELLTRQGITSPFPIQLMAIPEVLQGADVCGKAKTGSGKTLAFGLPMVQKLTDAESKRPRSSSADPGRSATSVTG